MLAVGSTLNNRYRIAKLVGQGGFGAVYRAWDLSLSQPVALKENVDTGPESQRQFEREAKLLAGLRHPNLPRVNDHFVLPGLGQYLVMDFVEGKSLRAMLVERGRPLDEAEVLPWVRQVCDALEYLHTRTPPIIHRDIKPDNIIVTPEGRAMLVDFGISKLYDPGKGTTVGAKAVTPGFSPPEQYAGGRTDPRSDIYALGATLYTLLTGQVPPEGPELSSGVAMLNPPRQINRAISEQTAAVIAAAMAPTISQRLASAADLAGALAGRMPSPPPTGPKVITPPLPAKPARSRGPARLLLALLLVAVLAVAAWLTADRLGVFDRFSGTPEPQATTLAGVTTVEPPIDPVAPTPTPGEQAKAAIDSTAAAVSPATEPTTAPVAATATTEAAVEVSNSSETPERSATATLAPGPPTATPTSAVVVPLFEDDGLVVINQPWEQDGVALTARSIEVRADSDGSDAAARVWFRLVNKTGQRLLVDIDWNTLHLEDSFGNRYNDWEPGSPTSVWVETGEVFDFDRYYSLIPGTRSRVPAEASFVQVVADQFSRVSGARWQYDINPSLSPVAAPPPGTTKAVGEAWDQDGLALRLTGLEVRADSYGQDAAARAWFEIANETNQQILVEIDYGRIAVVDSFGRRFGDWDGGGLFALTLDPGETRSFDRYYSDRSGGRSRVTRGTSFVVVTAEGVGRVAQAAWQLPLAARLSSGDTPAGAPPRRINEPWEQGGVSLSARTIEVRAESDGSDAAARVWFRLVNKTGQRLLVPIDWDSIYLEDGQGTRYVDWEGGATSVWVESGDVYDFDRTYSVIPDNRSRVPSSAGFVQVVVDQLSAVSGARWQYDINPQLQPAAEPAAGATKAVGDAWEQDGLELRLTNLEVRAESDGSDAAARAWYEVTNNTNQPMNVEIDFGRLALFDSFGRRFGDWDGGGLYAFTVAAGETTGFDRHYSEMSGARSRITMGAEYVVLAADNVAGLGAAAWRLDIVR